MGKWLVSLIDTSKLGGWVRAAAAGIIGTISAKYFGGNLSPDIQVALAGAVAGLVVGAWSWLAKKLDPDYEKPTS